MSSNTHILFYKLPKYILLLGCMLLVVVSSAQTLRVAQINVPNEPLPVWTGVFVKKEISKKLTATGKFSYFTDDYNFSSRFSDVGLTYEIIDGLSVGGFYRFRGKFTTHQRRSYAEVTYKMAPAKNLSIMGKLRVQRKLSEGVFQYHYRPRFDVRYKGFDMVQPYVSTELFFCGEGMMLSRDRFTVGSEFMMKKNDNMKLRVFLRYETRYGMSGIDNQGYTANVSYRIKFKYPENGKLIPTIKKKKDGINTSLPLIAAL